jgi:hypothetical protein
MSAPARTASAAERRAAQATAGAAALEARRKRGIQAIKVAQRQLGLDDGAYRAMLQAQTGKTSATALTVHEQSRVLDYMRANGAVNPKAASRAPAGGRKRTTPAADKVALRRRIDALLGQLSLARGEPYSLLYADAICKRNGWATCVDFCSAQDLHKLVGALTRTLHGRPAPQATR